MKDERLAKIKKHRAWLTHIRFKKVNQTWEATDSKGNFGVYGADKRSVGNQAWHYFEQYYEEGEYDE